MDLNIRQITTNVRATDAAQLGALGRLSEEELDRLAELLLARQARLHESAAARSLAPDDPAGELDRWS